MKNLNNGLNSIITDSIPLYFKDFISLQDDTKEFLSNVKGAKETKKELKELFHFLKTLDNTKIWELKFLKVIYSKVPQELVKLF
ncbi:hypothetical protein [Rice orange leaf phytoplasma]|uniref:hypothetical protein n=1 Tax=Rice orange leaf phytoplasma TaxID=146897 RepID=UPI0008F57F41|nr:hypothetical protein [Rice orange leaf phytoplasma]OIJ44764.1 hypothetical protein BHE82_01140 [Rice orange leaf phytoplasma]